MAQQYKNHRQIVYSYYLFTGFPILLLLGIGVWGAIKFRGEHQHYHFLFLLTAYILLTLMFRSRGFALKAQDRAIRGEEELRHFILTGKPLDHRLTLKQIIALRFASNEELPALAKKAVAGNLSASAIKQSIQQWRADEYRV